MPALHKLKVAGFSNYMIDTDGNVYNEKTNRLLKQQRNKSGYKTITLCKDSHKKTFLVHRLVAETFIRNDSNLPEVNHKDENKDNNSVGNLEWCTHCYNSHYGVNAPAKQMRKETIHKANDATRKVVIQFLLNGEKVREYQSAKDASALTGISRANIQKCCSSNTKNKTAGGYIWRYKEI